jgi:hypothetical protein
MPECRVTLTQKQAVQYSVKCEHVQRLERSSALRKKFLQLTIQIQSIMQNHFRFN